MLWLPRNDDLEKAQRLGGPLRHFAVGTTSPLLTISRIPTAKTPSEAWTIHCPHASISSRHVWVLCCDAQLVQFGLQLPMVQKSHVQKLFGSHQYFQVAIERDLQLI